MALNINGTTGISGVDGSVSAPALTGTDSNTGITFPAADTIKFSTGGVERIVINNSGISGTGISAGKILQVVSSSGSSNITTSGSAISELTNVSITPASASNKVLLIASCSLFTTANSNSFAGAYLYRGTTSGLIYTAISGFGTATDIYFPFSLTIVDSPNTTSAQTYTFSFSRQSGNTTSVSTNSQDYSLTALEIAA